MRRQFGSKRMSDTHNRAALRQLLVMRAKPLTESDVESLSRSYGVPVDQVEKMAREVAND